MRHYPTSSHQYASHLSLILSRTYRFLLVAFCFAACTSCIQAQGWVDKGAYRESSDKTGAIYQIEFDSASQRVISLSKSVKNTVYLQIWDFVTGALLEDRSIQDTSRFNAFACCVINPDLKTYTVAGVDKRSPNRQGFFVYSISNDSLVFFSSYPYGTDESPTFAIYDVLEKAIYLGTRADRSTTGGGPDFVYRTTGKVVRLRAGIDTVPNALPKYYGTCLSLKHRLGSYGAVYRQRYKEDSPYGYPRSDYAGALLKGSQVTDIASNSALDTYSSGVAQSHSQKFCAYGGFEAYFALIDTLSSRIVSTIGTDLQDADFSDNDTYLFFTQAKDSSLCMFHTGLQKICARVKLNYSLSKSIVRYANVAGSESVCIAGPDGRLRSMLVPTDSSAAAYTLNVDRHLLYRNKPVYFYHQCPAPSQTSSTIFFDDGSSSRELSISHSYRTAGTYHYHSQLSDANGVRNFFPNDSVVIINELLPSFRANNTFGTSPLDVEFVNTTTGRVLTYTWNFGDGTTSQEVSPKHRYEKIGSYTVSLRCWDGLTDTTIVHAGFVNLSTLPIRVIDFVVTEKRLTDGYSTSKYGENNTYTIPDIMQGTDGSIYARIRQIKNSRSKNDDLCGGIETCMTLSNKGTFESWLASFSVSNMFPDVNCPNFFGSMWPLRNGRIAYSCYHDMGPLFMFFLEPNRQRKEVTLHGFSTVFQARSLANGLDGYAHYLNLGERPKYSVVCFYRDTMVVRAIDTIDGRALAPIQISDGGESMVVISPPLNDKAQQKWSQYRYYDDQGNLARQLRFEISDYEDIYDIYAMSSGRFALCGIVRRIYVDTITKTSKTIEQGLFKIIDVNGTIISRQLFDTWTAFRHLVRLDPNTVAVTGRQAYGLPGFLVFRSDGSLVKEYRIPVPGFSLDAMAISFSRGLIYASFTDGHSALMGIGSTAALDDLVLDAPVVVQTETTALQCSPVPASSHMFLQFESRVEGPAELECYNEMSELVFRSRHDVVEGSNTLNVSTTDLASGPYYLRLRLADQVLSAKAMIVR